MLIYFEQNHLYLKIIIWEMDFFFILSCESFDPSMLKFRAMIHHAVNIMSYVRLAKSFTFSSKGCKEIHPSFLPRIMKTQKVIYNECYTLVIC